MGSWSKPDRDVYRHLLEVPLFAYSLFVKSNPPQKKELPPPQADTAPPVIFVHGIGGNAAHFLPMASYMKLRGRKNLYRVHLKSTTSIDRMAWRLAQYIKKVIRSTGAPQVDIIAHSLGGILVRLAIRDFNLQSSIKTLVTLGTPHQGTFSARFTDAKLGRQLRPDSSLITALKKESWPTGVRGINFWSQNDLVILPAESAYTDGAESIDISPSTHFSYLFSFKCWEAVWAALYESPNAGNT